MSSQPPDSVNQAMGDEGAPPAGAAGGSAAETERAILAAELVAAEAQRDAAVAALDKQGRRSRWWLRARQVLAGFLVVLFSVLLPITFVVAWGHRVALNTDGFESTVGPLVDDPVVTSAIATAVTNQIFTSLNAQQSVANALPARASFLAGPVTNAAKGYVQQAVTTVLQSDQFKALWQQATRFAHSELVAALEGHSNAVTTTKGQVVLDLVPLLNTSLQSMQGFISGLVGRQVTLPNISNNEIPATACQQISSALGRPLPSTCGQIPLFSAAKLVQARRGYRAFNGILVLLLILTPVIAALALWISRRRRRTLLQLAVGGVLGLVVIRRAVNWLSNELVSSGPSATREARQHIINQVFHQYFSVSRWIIVGLVIVFGVALVTGPYAWARWLRGEATRYAGEARNLAVALVGRARDDSTVEWIRAHLDLLRVVGVVVAVVLLLILSVSFLVFLIIAALLVVYEFWLYRLGRSAAPTPPADGEPEAAPTGASTPGGPPSGDAGPAGAV